MVRAKVKQAWDIPGRGRQLGGWLEPSTWKEGREEGRRSRGTPEFVTFSLADRVSSQGSETICNMFYRKE